MGVGDSRNRRSRAGADALGAVLAAVCFLTSCVDQARPGDQGKSTVDAPTHLADALPTPSTYEEGCALHPQVCSAATGSPPAGLWRSLDVPSDASTCPTTAAEPAPSELPFGGSLLPTGTPVRAIVGGSPDDALVATRGSAGWYSAKMLFFAPQRYQGPVLVRGAGIGDSGPVAFGEHPAAAAILVPPGPGTNVTDGYRHWPGALHVRGPGCFYVQVDGEDFSGHLVVEVTLSGAAT